MLLGAVGAYDWNGTVVIHKDGETVTPAKNAFYNADTEEGYEGLAGYLGELVDTNLIACYVCYLSTLSYTL